MALLGAADFDGDGSAHLIFAFSSPTTGPPYDTEIKVRYQDRMQTIARGVRAQPEPIWQIVRLPDGKRDGFMFHAATDWNWESAPPHLIGTEHGRFVDLSPAQKQFLIDATASERQKLASAPSSSRSHGARRAARAGCRANARDGVELARQTRAHGRQGSRQLAGRVLAGFPGAHRSAGLTRSASHA